LFEKLQQQRTEYNGFNLIAGTVDDLFHYGNNERHLTKLQTGTHSISNGSLDANWPKTKKAKEMLQTYVQHQQDIYIEDLFEQLNYRETDPNRLLSDTCVERQLLLNLSSIFIDNLPNYRTRVSTVLLVTHNNDVIFVERPFEQCQYADQTRFSFSI